jgi:6-phosphofructokinase 1
VKFIRSEAAGKTGAVISYAEGRLKPLPFDEMIDPSTGRMRVRRVNVDGETYECARRYMIRLERSDFEDGKRLARLASTVSMKPEEFRARFGYVVGFER